MGKPRVLVCDDSILMRRLVGDCLTSSGWQVAGEAGDGAQAIEKYQSLRPNAVTMDIVMPGTDGLTALTKILELDAEAKIVMISAPQSNAARVEAICGSAASPIMVKAGYVRHIGPSEAGAEHYPLRSARYI